MINYKLMNYELSFLIINWWSYCSAMHRETISRRRNNETISEAEQWNKNYRL